MVQISKGSLTHRRSRGRRVAFMFLSLLLSAVVPMMFTFRMFLPDVHNDSAMGDSSLLSVDSWEKASKESLLETLEVSSLPQGFGVLKRLDQVWRGEFPSDIVELRHCMKGLTSMDWKNFTEWALPIVTESVDNLKANDLNQRLFGTQWARMEEEFVLELLELYLTITPGRQHCDFDKYPLDIPVSLSQQQEKLHQVILTSRTPKHPRLAFVIVAFQDADYLQELIQAIHMPHHLIVVHLERRTPTDYRTQVEEIAAKHRNVVIVQFGSITYKTDSVSHVNFNILSWLHSHFHFDVAILLGGAVFPLYEPTEMANFFSAALPKQNVWLGELTHKGHHVKQPQWGVLTRKRLVYTMGKEKTAAKLEMVNFESQINDMVPDFIQTHMMYKTASGNQAAYSYEAVSKLVTSPQVKELFALAKYGCCCCIEEKSWIAALHMIGLGQQALKNPFMFQLWGGNKECGSSMSNVVLSQDDTLCYRFEDAFNLRGNTTTSAIRPSAKDDTYIRGNETMEYLKRAKQRGFLFARKFRSGVSSSVQLRQEIKSQLHKPVRQEENKENE